MTVRLGYPVLFVKEPFVKSGQMGVRMKDEMKYGTYSTYNAAIVRKNLEEKQRSQSKYLADMSLTLLRSEEHTSELQSPS